MLSEREKMLKGMMYNPDDTELKNMRLNAHRYSKQFNDITENEVEKRAEILKKLCPRVGEGTYISGPVFFDYGFFTSFGKNCFVNFNLTVLDCCSVKIGDDVFIGPNVTIAAPMHPLLAKERNRNINGEISEYAKPVEIGDNCWIGANVVICGGVKIGNNCVIGAGSVVTKDIPDGMLAAGNPCISLRQITDEDSVKLRPELWED